MKLNWQQRKKDLMISIDFLVVAMLLVFAGWWAYTEFMTSPPYVDNERYPIRGIDVSSHNGDIDFKAVARDGIEFVFIKASEGGDFHDEKFKTNHNGARRAGLKVGAYHFFRFDRDGVEQAINLLRAVDGHWLDLGLVIDIEAHGNPEGIPPAIVVDRLVAMVDYLNLLGHHVTFYTNRDGYYDYIADNFNGYPIWICSFSSNPLNAEWQYWQYDHHGRVQGIDGDVDLNVFYGNREEWENAIRYRSQR